MASTKPKPVAHSIDFLFKSTVIDNFNIWKINFKIKHKIAACFQKHRHKLPLYIRSILTLTNCTENHVGNAFESLRDVEFYC